MLDLLRICKLFILIVLILSTEFVFSQSCLNEIDFNLIPQKKVKDFIVRQIEQNQIYFSDIKASCPIGSDIKGFHYQKQNFIIGDSVSSVWKSYVSTNPSYSWEGNILSFGMLFSKRSNTVMYRNQNYNGIEIGQVYYINLKIWGGIYNLAVAFEVIGIDNKEHKIELSYINGGKSQGRQTIQFKFINENSTLVTHYSYFKSESDFRDSFIYPFFHERVVKEFHGNMMKLIGEK